MISIELYARRMAERAITRRGGIGAILGTGDRDFLVRSSGEQVSKNIRKGLFPVYFSLN